VKPPKVNKNKKPKVKILGLMNIIEPVHKVANQLNILIPVGIAITEVVAVKYALVSISKPTVYIWCPHTIQPNKPIENIANIIPSLPKITLLEYLDTVSLIIPNPGKINI
jgi:hypothetical protein